MNDKSKKYKRITTTMADRMIEISKRQSSLVFIKRLDTRMQNAETPSISIHAPLCSFVYLTSGTVLVSHSKRTVILQQGECMIIPAGDDFAVRYYNKCTGYMGAFHSEVLPDQTVGLPYSEDKFVLTHHRCDFMNALMERLVEENSNAAPDLQTVKYCLMLFLSEIRSAGRNSNRGEKSESHNQLCDKFMNLVFENFHNNLTIDDYAERLNISSTHLYKTIKRHTGRTPLEWIHEALISEAKIQLSYGNSSIAEIASLLGLFDASYFTRLFRKHTGMSPTQYRKCSEKS